MASADSHIFSRVLDLRKWCLKKVLKPFPVEHLLLFPCPSTLTLLSVKGTEGSFSFPLSFLSFMQFRGNMP